MAKFGHRAQFRKEVDHEGFPLRYFEHVRRVAIVLMDDVGIYEPDLVIAALLHDVIEDTEDIDAAVIEQFFGGRVAHLVLLLTKDPKEGYVRRLETDLDAVLLKACDRLDNLRSLDAADMAFRLKQCRETRDVYLPLFRAGHDPRFDSKLYDKVQRLAFKYRDDDERGVLDDHCVGRR